ncbi:MarR family transcriptional regulator [Rhodobacter sp. TJ_12]|uniref:MarR family winged helix-turn-helix transcriptional regulator n=1 Tax=Rhodobacter sp. TJ_12 TaxID=2029399 RepID=UPI001CBB3F38|nr:MarR family transcriptional regulator [Rhodobacter sp. TJ_12]MBZ4021549.1 MarR family transcriptional regulator [Rhodobacter sp. TJ_12]
MQPSDSSATEKMDCFDEICLDVLNERLSYYLRVLNLGVASDLDALIAHLPVARGTGKISTLFAVMHQPGISASEIAPFAGKDAPAMTRLVDRLIDDGLLERRADPDTRRRQCLFITEQGRAVMDQVRAVLDTERAQMFGVLSDEEHAEALRLMRKMAAGYVQRALPATRRGGNK